MPELVGEGEIIRGYSANLITYDDENYPIYMGRCKCGDHLYSWERIGLHICKDCLNKLEEKIK